MKKLQVVGIGNALVDVLTTETEEFLSENGVDKGIMQLIDRDRARTLYDRVGPATEISGGSAANTIAGIAQLGGRTAYVGKVRDDQLGAIFAHDLRAQGAGYDTRPAPADHARETGRCIVIVTPDGERSMNTYLGVTEELGPEDIDPALMGDADWIYLEGYRFDGPGSHEAFAKALEASRKAGGRGALTLSDPFCVERHRDAFRRMIRDDIDLLFCNRAELLSMYQTDDFDAALAEGAADVAILACTDSANGAHVMHEGNHWHVPATPVAKVVDATGAGDLFASGFLWAVAEGMDLETAGRAGCIAAGEVITHIGARAETDLRSLLKSHGIG
ncbi:adenosine kinase [Brevirhabdus pacifica]|uniref:Adenosine kinase n=1 Tax=Brevirhabdus pacifica TaxID=1267768 RepID=A0A1U7DHX3_9RHOB|nr:adenosine kinase [Brevirhabdus pacifica]APX89607.1 adenosine kinase [Brevirhabdus pacifica]OWU74279.1 carbohydrate kinase [Loktanella sp. 22II-4b]PJJ85721.1 sugar/nucleoside kinase (ribokinase family) [Brevirhabdus pacifica]